MTIRKLDENWVEDAAHNIFDNLGYDVLWGPDHHPGTKDPERNELTEVILEKRLRDNLEIINPGLLNDVYEQAIGELYRISSNDTMTSNRNFHELLLNGVNIKIPDEKGKNQTEHVDFVKWNEPLKNNFLALRQFTVKQFKERRADHVIFLNGIPIIIIEYKNPSDKTATIQKAYDQLGETNYQKYIPKLFHYNAFNVISDRKHVRYGTFESPPEFFFTWYEDKDMGEKYDSEDNLEVYRLDHLIKEVFPKEKLLNILEHFIEYEDDGRKIIKKIGRKHQIQTVNKLVAKTIDVYNNPDEKRLGIVFHSTGSGKSMSMIFFTEMLSKIKSLNNPTFVILTDRNDLDDQISNFFEVAGFPNKKPKQTMQEAEDIEDLRKKLQIPAGNIIFTTIQKFQRTKEEKIGKVKYPELSTRKNIIIMADEAHRSEYGIMAQNLSRALPNALLVGFTATPIELDDRSTSDTFGDPIGTYTQKESVRDGTTVEIVYDGRLEEQHILNEFIGKDYEQITASLSEEQSRALSKKWANVTALVEREERIEDIAKDVVFHFNSKKGVIPKGKAMLCATTKKAAGKYYEYITKQPNAPKCICIISGGTKTKDPTHEQIEKEDYLKEHYRSKKQIKDLVEDFKDENNSVELLIVCDMYLTGFDAPLLHTLYIDKPLRDHNLFQAASRVNRKWKPEKIAGLVIDYIGIADDLKRSFKSFNENDFKGTFKPTVEILKYMKNKHAELMSFFEIPIENRDSLSSTDYDELFLDLVNEVQESENQKLEFFKNVSELTKAYGVCTPNSACQDVYDDMVFFQTIRTYIGKNSSNSPYIPPEVDNAVKQLIEKGIKASNSFKKYSIEYDSEKFQLNEEYMKKIGTMKQKNLKVELAHKLLDDAITFKFKRNNVIQKSFRERLENALSKYHGRFEEQVTFETVWGMMEEVAKDVTNKKKKEEELGLSPEEIIFYDAISAGKKYTKSDESLVEIAIKLTKFMEKNTSVDWLNQESTKAKIRSGIKKILRDCNFPAESFETLVPVIFQQAESNYSEIIEE
jgi:type I restriction enzyme, R subunit